MNNMEKQRYTYKAIENLSDDVLKQAYDELKEGLPKGNESIVRRLQSELHHENNGYTIPLNTVMYRVAMEMLKRFYVIE